jgi:porin
MDMDRNTNTMKQLQKSLSIYLAMLFIAVLVKPVFAQSSERSNEEGRGGFGGPDAVENRIESDRAEKEALYEFSLLRPSYYAWKQSLREKYGYSFGVTYVPVYVKASDSLPGSDDYASTAAIRHFGSWELLGRGTPNTGKLNYLIEYRHGIADADVAPFSLTNLGNVGAIGIPFVDDQWHLTNLYWDQSWQNGKYEVFAGFLDVTDYVDVHPLTSPWTDYFNYSFSIGAGTMDFGDDAGLGLAFGAVLTDNLYTIAGFKDINSDPTDPSEGFDTFFTDQEYFKHVEIGWTSSPWDAWFLNNIHVTLWQADEREATGVDDGWGGVFSLNRTVGDKWMVFARSGFAEDGGSLLERSVSIGGGYTPNGLESLGAGSQLGFGMNWGRPNEAVFGSGLDDQFAAEAYYRLQLTKELAVTPSIQLLVDPALNPQEDAIWVFGLRARLAF